MTKRWCPITHGDCENGITKESDALCTLYDSVYEECSYTQGLLYSCQTQRMMLDPLRRETLKELRKLKPGEISHLEG